MFYKEISPPDVISYLLDKNKYVLKGEDLMYKVSTLADEYKKKLVTADEAVAIVKPGDRVHYGTGCGSPVDPG